MLWPFDEGVEPVFPKLKDMVSGAGDACLLGIEMRRCGRGALAQECCIQRRRLIR